MNEHKWLFFIVAAIGLIYTVGRQTKWNKKRCIQALTILLTCFAGLRSWRMGDVQHYCWAYLECNLPDWKINWLATSGDTVGIQLLFRGVGQLGLGFEVCIFLIAAFLAVTLGVLVYRYSPSPFWSYVMYLAMGFYMSSMDILKQAIAMGFVMWAMMAVLEHRPVRFLMFVGVAALFHTPALVFLVVYPFANKKIDIYYFFILIGMVAAVFFFRDEIVEFAGDLYYVEGTEFEAESVLGGKTVVMVLILILALVLRPLKQYDVMYRQLFNVMILAAIVQSFSVYDNVFTRLAEYFFQFVVLFMPVMLQSGKVRARLYPEHATEIYYLEPKAMFVLQIGIVVFAVWFYNQNVDSAAYLKQFCFLWEDDGASSLELLREMLAEYGG